MISKTDFLRFISCISFVLLGGFSPLALADLTAYTDRTIINENESLKLTLELNETLNGTPNFDVLSRDFEWSRPSQSSSMQMINGRTSAKTTWTVELLPKRSGQLTIPSMGVQGHLSQPFDIKVRPGPQTLDEKIEQSLVFMTQTISNETPYVQEPFKVTFKIHHAAELIRGGLSDWTLEQARIDRLEEQTQYRTQIKGRTYLVTEVHYWITPQQSGPLILPSLTFQGEINTRPTRSFSPFASLSGQRVSDRTAEKTLSIRAKPAQYPSNTPWLPAKNIRIDQDWQPEQTQVIIGDAITRTLNIHITGQWPELIPSLSLEKMASHDLKIYPDQPQIESQRTHQGVSGTKSVSYAIIPSTAKTLHLPEKILYWWNIEKDRLEKTVIPARTLQARNLQATTPPQSQAAQPSTTSPQPLTQDNASQTDAALSDTPSQSDSPPAPQVTNNTKERPFYSPWFWLTILFAGLWLATLTAFWRLWHKKNSTANSDPDRQPTTEFTKAPLALKQLKTACHQTDLKSIEIALLNWAKCHWSDQPPISIGHIVKRLDRFKDHAETTNSATTIALITALKTFEQLRYNAQHQASWSPKSLYQAVHQYQSAQKNLLKTVQQKRVRSHLSKSLPPLHPTT